MRAHGARAGGSAVGSLLGASAFTPGRHRLSVATGQRVPPGASAASADAKHAGGIRSKAPKQRQVEQFEEGLGNLSDDEPAGVALRASQLGNRPRRAQQKEHAALGGRQLRLLHAQARGDFAHGQPGQRQPQRHPARHQPTADRTMVVPMLTEIADAILAAASRP